MNKGTHHTKKSIRKMRKVLKGRKPPKTAWKKGRIPWNKGTKGVCKAWNKKEDIFIKCENCGKKFQVHFYRKNTAKFCSNKCLGEFRKGKLSGRKGEKHPQNSGKNHYNWKNGITSINEKIRKSLEYKEWRRQVFQRDNWTCVKCGYKSKGNDIRADHIKPFSLYPELRLDIDNGRTLCIKCDRKYGWNYRRALIKKY